MRPYRLIFYFLSFTLTGYSTLIYRIILNNFSEICQEKIVIPIHP